MVYFIDRMVECGLNTDLWHAAMTSHMKVGSFLVYTKVQSVY